MKNVIFAITAAAVAWAVLTQIALPACVPVGGLVVVAAVVGFFSAG